MDVDTAFLYGVLPTTESPIYTTVPEGYPVPAEFENVDRKDLVCHVHKAIYGLKQSPRLWNQNLHQTMINNSFSQSKHDPCLYSKGSGRNLIHVAIYVDDLIIAGASAQVISQFKTSIAASYNMKDLGALSHCLGMEIVQDIAAGTVKVSQRSYSLDILRRFGMLTSNSSPIPMAPHTQLPLLTTSPVSSFKYREIVGSLMYLMVCTRPDLAFSVGRLSRHLQHNTEIHHTAALQVLRYLKGSLDEGITYSRSVVPGYPIVTVILIMVQMYQLVVLQLVMFFLLLAVLSVGNQNCNTLLPKILLKPNTWL